MNRQVQIRWHRSPHLEVLLAAKVALRGLDGNMPKKKLDLFEFTSCLVAQNEHTFYGDRAELALLGHSSQLPL